MDFLYFQVKGKFLSLALLQKTCTAWPWLLHLALAAVAEGFLGFAAVGSSSGTLTLVAVVLSALGAAFVLALVVAPLLDLVVVPLLEALVVGYLVVVAGYLVVVVAVAKF